MFEREKINLGGELSGVGESVVGDGVSQVILEVLKGALSGDNGLDEESKAREHGEASVLDLLHLELSQGVWVVSQAQGVEVLATGVQGVKVLAESVGANASVGTEGLSLTHQDDLDSGDGDDGLGMDQTGLAQVVEASLGEDLGSGLEPDGLGGAGLVELGDEDAQGTEQGPAGMDDLDLTVALEGLGVSRQTSSILYTSRVRVRRSRGISTMHQH